MLYGNGVSKSIDWEILASSMHHEDVNFKPPTRSNVIGADIDFDNNAGVVFFKHIFPSVEGHAKIIDKYLSNPAAEYYSLVWSHKIQFFDVDDKDPDWKVKQCYLILIAAATETENGDENLWMKGMHLWHPYPDFRCCMSQNEMKAFCSAAPFCWTDDRYWYAPDRDTPWEVFLPCIYQFNDRCQKLIWTSLLLLDESMSGWQPKISKLGGLPNYMFEPRKPVPLWTMFWNGVECMSNVLVFQDVVQLHEVQSPKKYFGEESHLPNKANIRSHAAEDLHQVEGAKVKPGGWVGGDSWFGSVLSAVEMKWWFDVHSTWVIKQNTDFFPMKVMHSVLHAWHGEGPAGHWVVFCVTIGEVALIAIAYAWSQSSISYFVSTCGSTRPATESNETHFEDEFGLICSHKVNWPELLPWVYDYSPLVNEHNKQWQSLLHLEKKWPMKNCWFHLLTMLVGISVVDMDQVYLPELW